MAATRAAVNPIPLLTSFYRKAKALRADDDYVFGAADLKTINSIIENESYAGFSGRSLSNLLQAINLTGGNWEMLKEHNLAKPIVESILHHSPRFSPRDIASILTYLSQLKMRKQDYQETGLDELFVKIIKSSIKHFNSQDLSNMLAAFVTFDFTWEDIVSRELDKLIFSTLSQLSNDLEEQSIANILWSLAHLGITWDELKVYQLDSVLLKTIEQNYTQMDAVLLTQLKQAQLWFDFQLSDELQQDLDAELKKLPKPKSSSFHINISRRIQRLTPVKVQNEKCYGLVLWVDIGFENYNVCIEIDGPFHEDHLDRFKNKLLAKFGVTVLRINYKDDTTLDFLKNLLIENNIKIREPSDRYCFSPPRNSIWHRKEIPSNTDQPMLNNNNSETQPAQMMDEIPQSSQAIKLSKSKRKKKTADELTEQIAQLLRKPARSAEEKQSSTDDDSSGKEELDVIMKRPATIVNSSIKNAQKFQPRVSKYKHKKKEPPITGDNNKAYTMCKWSIFAVNAAVAGCVILQLATKEIEKRYF